MPSRALDIVAHPLDMPHKQWKDPKREEEANERDGHGVADVTERAVSRSPTQTPPAYSDGERSRKSRSASEPPKRKRGEPEALEEGGKAAQMAHYQSRLAKLREEELDLENTHRIEEAKLEILSKQRRSSKRKAHRRARGGRMQATRRSKTKNESERWRE